MNHLKSIYICDIGKIIRQLGSKENHEDLSNAHYVFRYICVFKHYLFQKMKIEKYCKVVALFDHIIFSFIQQEQQLKARCG